MENQSYLEGPSNYARFHFSVGTTGIAVYMSLLQVVVIFAKHIGSLSV